MEQDESINIPFLCLNWRSLLMVMIAVAGVLTHAWLGQSGTELKSMHALGSDDAFISYRYAKNLFAGHGLVFNPGERVEGYSNLLYTLLITPVFFWSADWVYQYSVLLNCLLLAFTLCIFYGYLTRQFGEKKAIFGTLLLVLNPWVWANAATGLETMLILAITTGSWILLERYLSSKNRKIIPVLLFISALSIFARVDGFILPLAIVVYAIYRNERKLALNLFLLVVAIGVVYSAWRYYYYDDVISNTYYAKVSGDHYLRIKRGFGTLYENAVRTGFWVPLCVIGLQLVTGLRQRNVGSRIDFAIFFIVLWSGYFIYIGGDVYYERFIVALFPMGIFTAMSLLQPVNNKLVWYSAFVAMLVIQSVFVLSDGRFRYSLNKYDCWVTAGKFLGMKYPGETLAVDAAGKIPYFSGLKTIDMLGLNDKHIGKMAPQAALFRPGHLKFDPQYVLSRKPQLIAAWIAPTMDLYWGLAKSIYEQDYTLKYLVNTSRIDKAENNIIDVEHLSKRDQRSLMLDSYDYAILYRKPDTQTAVPGTNRLLPTRQPNGASVAGSN